MTKLLCLLLLISNITTCFGQDFKYPQTYERGKYRLTYESMNRIGSRREKDGKLLLDYAIIYQNKIRINDGTLGAYGLMVDLSDNPSFVILLSFIEGVSETPRELAGKVNCQPLVIRLEGQQSVTANFYDVMHDETEQVNGLKLNATVYIFKIPADAFSSMCFADIINFDLEYTYATPNVRHKAAYSFSHNSGSSEFVDAARVLKKTKVERLR